MNAQGKRWCFTINHPTSADSFWENEAFLRANFQYIVLQDEIGEQGTPHIQGFAILKTKKRGTWLQTHCTRRGHYEIARGTNQQAADYCKKDDTHQPDSLRFEWGQLPERAAAPKHQERLQEAMEEVEILKAGYKRPAEVGASTLLMPGYIQAYKLLTQTAMGPWRPDLKIITIIGPPGCGKSYSLFKHFPNAGRACYGNGGLWWSNPTADVLLIEEFNGQIQLQKLLQLLDPYPQQIEFKGGMAPVCAHVIAITSNVTPDKWYRVSDFDTADDSGKRSLSIQALYDRIGFAKDEKQIRNNAFYLAPEIQEGEDQPYADQIQAIREWLMDQLDQICSDLGPWYTPPSMDE